MDGCARLTMKSCSCEFQRRKSCKHCKQHSQYRDQSLICWGKTAWASLIRTGKFTSCCSHNKEPTNKQLHRDKSYILINHSVSPPEVWSNLSPPPRTIRWTILEWLALTNLPLSNSSVLLLQFCATGKRHHHLQQMMPPQQFRRGHHQFGLSWWPWTFNGWFSHYSFLDIIL